MPGLRIETFRWLTVEQDKLSPNIGCGMVLKRTPKFYGSDAFNKVLSSYSIRNIYTDTVAQKLLQSEKTIKQFYTSALSLMSLNDNFRITFANSQLFLLVDFDKESAWILGEVENRLLFINYYRDLVPNILKEFGIVISGSYGRLMPVGWQNLYDVIDAEFVKSYSDIKTIEILSVLTKARWRSPILSIGINLLNLAAPETIREKVAEVFEKNISS